MRQVFWFDSYGNVQSKEVAEDYVLQDGELDPQPKQEIGTEQKTLANLGLRVAQLTDQNKKLTLMVSQLGLEMAKGVN